MRGPILIAVATLLLAVTFGVSSSLVGVGALALPVALVGGLLLFVNPFVGVLLVVGTVPLESALMVGGRSAPALLGMAVVGVWGVRKLVYRESLVALVEAGWVKLAFLLLAFAALSVTWATYPAGIEGRLFLFVQLLLLAIVVADLSSSQDRMTAVCKWLVVAGAIAAALTLQQYYVGGVRRAGMGITGSINRTSLTLVTIVPFAFYLVRAAERRAWRLLGVGYVGLCALAVTATFSRMNFIVFPLVVLVHLVIMARTRLGRRRILLIGGAALIALNFVPMDAVEERADSIVPYLSQTVAADEQAGTMSGRGFHMLVGWEIFKDHPLVGAGYDNYGRQFLTYQWRLGGADRLYRTPRSPHSSHLAFLSNLGIIGFLLWSSLFVVAIRYLWKARRHAGGSESREVAWVEALLVAVALQVAYGMYGEIHNDKIFWVVMGLVLAVRRWGGPVNPDQPPVTWVEAPDRLIRGARV